MGKLRYILILLLCLISYNGWAATYYIDFAGGADTNNGTATGTPFKHCPGDANATNTAAATNLAQGDIVVFKGGVVYTPPVTGIVLNWSGAAGNPIVYDGDSGSYASRWAEGTTKAIVDGGNVLNGLTGVYGFKASSTRAYVTINNFEIRNLAKIEDISGYNCTTSTVPQHTGYGIYMANPNNVVISNNFIHDISLSTNVTNSTNNAFLGYGIDITGGQYVTIRNNELSEVWDAIKVAAVYNALTTEHIEIHDNYTHDYVVWHIDLGNYSSGASSGTVQDIKIYNNRFEFGGEYVYGGTWQGCGTLYPHTDGVFIRRNASTADVNWGTEANPIRVYQNKFYQITTGDGVGTSAINLNSMGGHIYIYNNLFAGVNMANGNIQIADSIYAAGGSTPLDARIYNNTFANSGYDWAIFLRTLSAGYELNGGTNSISIKNNIFYTTSASNPLSVLAYTATDNPTVLDYNIYQNATSTGNVIDIWVGGSSVYRTLAQAQAAGYETHGIKASILFTDITSGFGANILSNDFTLQSESSAVNVGEDLSALFTTDLLTNARPTGVNSWDMGAYERGATGDVTAPTIISAVINATGTGLTITFSESVTVADSSGFTINMSGGAAGLSYKSATSNTMTFDITGRAIDVAETGTLDCVTVANGIQDAAGNDLASTGETDESVTNNSEHTPSEVTYTITVQESGNASLSPLSNQVVVTGDNSTTFTCAPINSGYKCKWGGTCGAVGNATTYQKTAIDADCTVTLTAEERRIFR